MVQSELPTVSQGTNEEDFYNRVPLIVSLLSRLSPTTLTGYAVPLSRMAEFVESHLQVLLLQLDVLASLVVNHSDVATVSLVCLE